MHRRNTMNWAVCVVVLVFSAAVVYAQNNNATSTNTTTGKASVVTTTGAPGAVKSGTSQPSKNATDADDCEDEPSAEPEGAAVNGTRQGKQLTLGDPKDKYTHEDGKAEPEPESKTGQLTGNATTTARPAHGSASAPTSGTCVLGTVLAAGYLRLSSFS